MVAEARPGKENAIGLIFEGTERKGCDRPGSQAGRIRSCVPGTVQTAYISIAGVLSPSALGHLSTAAASPFRLQRRGDHARKAFRARPSGRRRRAATQIALLRDRPARRRRREAGRRCAARPASSHILSFIAGAMMIGPSNDSRVVLSRSSASPQAALARMLAVAGATQKTSAARASSMCGCAPGPKTLVRTGRPVRASKVFGPTSRVAERVIRTDTSGPGLDQAADQGGRLVGGDPPADADKHFASVHRFWKSSSGGPPSRWPPTTCTFNSESR